MARNDQNAAKTSPKPARHSLVWLGRNGRQTAQSKSNGNSPSPTRRKSATQDSHATAGRGRTSCFPMRKGSAPGFYLSGHPLARFQTETESVFVAPARVSLAVVGKHLGCAFAGMISNVRRHGHPRAKKEPYARCRFEDLDMAKSTSSFSQKRMPQASRTTFEATRKW